MDLIISFDPTGNKFHVIPPFARMICTSTFLLSELLTCYLLTVSLFKESLCCPFYITITSISKASSPRALSSQSSKCSLNSPVLQLSRITEPTSPLASIA